MSLKKVVSGGQTGVDEAALFTAKSLGIPTGGLMPKGFRTLEGYRPEYKEIYGLEEHKSPNYPPRTFANVKNSDGTLRIFTKKDSAGEICTLKAINQYNKPYLDIHLDKFITFNELVQLDKRVSKIEFDRIVEWVSKIEILNVAGNSEKTSPDIFRKASIILYKVFKSVNNL